MLSVLREASITIPGSPLRTYISVPEPRRFAPDLSPSLSRCGRNCGLHLQSGLHGSRRAELYGM